MMSERERFEQFMRDHALDDKIHFARRDGGTYAYPGMSTLWQGWQARARIAEQEKRELLGLLEMIQVAVNMTDEYFEGRENPEAVRDWAKKARALLAKHEATP